MPQRFLRPGLITSERWNALSWAAQSFYVRLILLSDDYGRYEAGERHLKATAFPMRDDVALKDIAPMCREVAANDLAFFYRKEGKDYLQLTNWKEKPRSPHAYFPAYDSACKQMFADVCKCFPLPLVIVSSPSQSPSHSQSEDFALSSSEDDSQKRKSKPNPMTDEEWLKSLVSLEAYRGINIEAEFGKMVAWCGPNNQRPTRKRFLNWLNRCGKTMTLPGRGNVPQGGVSAWALKQQMEAIDAQIAEVKKRGFEDAFGVKLKAEDQAELAELFARRQEIVKRMGVLT